MALSLGCIYILSTHRNGLCKSGASKSSIGRFTQYDSSGQEAHPYAYASGNPVDAKDPSGLGDFCTFAFLAVAALGLLTAQVGLTGAVLAITGVGAPAVAAVGIAAATLGVQPWVLG